MKMPFKRTLRVKLFVIILLGLILSISAFFAGTFALPRNKATAYKKLIKKGSPSAKAIYK